jgi:uroporphyrinogen-III synthase
VTLAGKRVLVARAEGQADAAVRLLRERGAEPVVIPSITVGPPDDEDALKKALKELGSFDWLVLTSANGVDALFAEMPSFGVFSRLRVAVVGPATAAALESHGVTPALVARAHRGEALGKELTTLVAGRRVILLRAQEAPNDLPDALIEAGALLQVVAAYQTRPSLEGAAQIARQLRERSLDVVIFSSGSTVDSICDALGPDAPGLLSPVAVACIGPVTRQAALSRGVRVDVTPAVSTFLAVVDALEARARGI